jgi:F0F1-type ATP synthase delta subunit
LLLSLSHPLSKALIKHTKVQTKLLQDFETLKQSTNLLQNSFLTASPTLSPRGEKKLLRTPVATI